MTAPSTKPDSVPQRLAHADEIPASAARLAQLADQHGWTSSTFYSRGVRLDERATLRVPLVDVNTGTPLLTDKGKPRVEILDNGPKVTDNITVRLDRRGVRLVGVWVDGSWQAGLVGVNGRQQMRLLQSRQLADAVKDPT